MSVTPVDLWQYADANKASNSEVQQRCSISRAYYGAYHSCLHWHAKLAAPGSAGAPGSGMHQVLINQLRNPDATLAPDMKLRSKSLGYALQALKGDRELADYGIADPIPVGKAVNACAAAKQIIDKSV